MVSDTVSGRTYTATRVRGFAPWNPRQDARDLVARVQAILATYQAQLPLTIRQIFYVLVGSAEGYPKTEQAYARLAETLNRARRAQMIPFSSIRDDGTQSVGWRGWNSPAQFWRGVRGSAEHYQHDLTEGQPFHVELWVEAGGMVPQAANVAGDYGITTYSAGGFNGLTDKYETASRLARASDEKPCIVLHCGDYDPSGLSIVDSLASDVCEFHVGLRNNQWTRAALYNTAPPVEFRRIVVIPEQIERYSLPGAPQKSTDNRGEYMEETVQAEALPPDVLAAEIRQAIEDVCDLDQLQDMRDRGEQERREILETLDQVI